MYKQLLFSVLLFLLSGISLNAQCLQDTLFQSHLIQDAQFITGKVYLLQKREQNRPPSEYSRSPFVKVKETPEFDYKGEVTNSIHYSEIGDRPITFLGQYEDQTFIIGNDTIDFNVTHFEINGERYQSFINTSRRKNRNISVKVSPLYRYLTEQSFTEEIRDALVGKTVYTLSAKWMQYNDKEKNSNLEFTYAEDNTYKYYPVKITSVINDYDNKFIIYFQPEGLDKTYCFTNVTFGKEELRSSMNFRNRMTFQDPRKNHPKISNKQWKNIQSQAIEKGMTTEEVKIAFGNADEEYETNGDDIWIYYNVNNKDISITFRKGKVHEYVTRKAARW